MSADFTVPHLNVDDEGLAATDAAPPPVIGEQCTNVFIANIPSAWTMERLRGLLTAFGTLLNLKYVQDRRFAFANFSSASAAHECIQGLHGFHPSPTSDVSLHVAHALHGETNEEPNERLFIRGLPDFMTTQALRAIVQPHGELEEVKVILHGDGRCKGSGFATFRSVDSATKCLQAINGTTFNFQSPDGARASSGTLEAKYCETEATRAARRQKSKERVAQKALSAGPTPTTRPDRVQPATMDGTKLPLHKTNPQFAFSPAAAAMFANGGNTMGSNNGTPVGGSGLLATPQLGLPPGAVPSSHQQQAQPPGGVLMMPPHSQQTPMTAALPQQHLVGQPPPPPMPPHSPPAMQQQQQPVVASTPTPVVAPPQASAQQQQQQQPLNGGPTTPSPAQTSSGNGAAATTAGATDSRTIVLNAQTPSFPAPGDIFVASSGSLYLNSVVQIIENIAEAPLIICPAGNQRPDWDRNFSEGYAIRLRNSQHASSVVQALDHASFTSGEVVRCCVI